MLDLVNTPNLVNSNSVFIFCIIWTLTRVFFSVGKRSVANSMRNKEIVRDNANFRMVIY